MSETSTAAMTKIVVLDSSCYGETDLVDAYIALGWRLLHVGTDTQGEGTSRVLYTLGWSGDRDAAPEPERPPLPWEADAV